MSYLNPGLPRPVPSPDGLDAPYWKAAAENRLVLQRCSDCGTYQWGPEWTCHNCCSENLVFEEILPHGRIYSYERVWHPVHPALAEQGPYIVVLVEFPNHDGARMVGNLLGDPLQEVKIGGSVEAVFEHHADAENPYTLVQWRVSEQQ
ncbi:MAG: OB-fold domain-containing protein [Gammaproteobacteria bacterium]|nr:OB-fold domain-containing protein [Gammaproteobacteria bacterium]